MSTLFYKQVFKKVSGVILAFVMVFGICAQGMVSLAANVQITDVVLNETRTIITLNLSSTVTAQDSAALAGKILISYGGASTGLLPSGSIVSVSGTTIQLSMTTPITTAQNYIVIPAGCLEGQDTDITSPVFNGEGPKLLADGVLIDDSKKVVTLKFAEAFSGYPNDEALKNGYITLARNGSYFGEVIPADKITVEGSSGQITIRLDTALSGSSSQIKIAAGRVKNRQTGNINLDDITTPSISANFDKTPPQLDYSNIGLSSNNTTITLNFDENIYNVYATGVSSSAALEFLKSHIWLDRNGAGYRVLGGQDTITISGNQLIIRLATALTGNNNTLKIDSGSLRDTAGNSLNTTIETGRLIASNSGSASGAPQYNDLTGSYLSSDLRTVTFTFDRNIMRNPNITESQMRSRIYVQRNNGSYSSISYYDSVSFSGNRLIITLNQAFSGNNNRVKVDSGTIASTSGDILYSDVESMYFGGSTSGNGPRYNSVSYNPTNRQVRIRFDTDIYVVSSYNLKNNIYISKNGGAYNPLSSYDSVQVYGSDTLLITLDGPLSGSNNRFRVLGGTLKNAYGEVQYNDQTTGTVGGSDFGTDEDFKTSFSLSQDRKTALIVFDRNIFSNYPYDTNYASLKQAISISRNSGMAYSSLGSYDSVSISGRTLSVTMQKEMSDSDVIRIGRNAIKDSYGNVLGYETKVGPSLNRGDNVFDPDNGVTISEDKYIVTFKFKQQIYNNMSSVSSLKSMIRVAYDGSNYELLDNRDSVSFQNYGEISITFNRPLLNENARVKILAGALQNAKSETINYDMISNALGRLSGDTEVTLGGARVYFTNITSTQDAKNNKLYTVAIKSTSATAEIGAKSNGVALSVKMPSSAYSGKLVMNGDILKLLQSKNATITVECGGVAHILPTAVLDLTAMIKQLGADPKLPQNVVVELGVSRVELPYTTDLAKRAGAESFKVITQPTEFTIHFKAAGKTQAITKYSKFIEKRFALKPSEAQNSNITVVRVETSGEVNHVPSKLEIRGGDYFLSAKTRSNGVYAVISASHSFRDTPQWAASAVNSLASRLIVQGKSGTALKPSEAVNRSEVAGIVTRSMGLLTDKSGASKFLDVTLTDPYFTAVAVAAEYDLIKGYGNSSFKPERKITRQEAMAIIARTIRLARDTSVSSSSSITNQQANKILSKFKDSASVANWAKVDMAECVQAGIINGDDRGMVNPDANVTRAELIQMMYNILKKYEMIG